MICHSYPNSTTIDGFEQKIHMLQSTYNIRIYDILNLNKILLEFNKNSIYLCTTHISKRLYHICTWKIFCSNL